MRAFLYSSSDFKQMLVTSVFVHFLLMTVFMFFPRAVTQAKVVIPAFRVNLIEAPSVARSKPGQDTVKSQKRIAPTKPQKAVAPRKPDLAAHLLRELDALSGKTLPAPPNSIVQELDKLAKMVSPKFKKTAPEKKQKVWDKTFKDLEEVKKKKPAFVPAPKPLIEETLPDEAESPEIIVSEEVVDEAPRNSETGPPAREKTEAQEPTTVELLEELEKISALDSVLKTEPQIEPSAVKQPEVPLEKQETAFLQPIIKKLDALAEPGRNVEISVSVNPPEQDEFKSQIQLGEGTAPDEIEASLEKPSPAGEKQQGLSAPDVGETSADALSLYIGEIRARILAHWKSPLGTNQKDEVFVSFYLFRGGNIDKPFLEKSSGKAQLDTLAVRAIFDSEPFPEFPDELKEPNLHIKIHFTYTPVDE